MNLSGAALKDRRALIASLLLLLVLGAAAILLVRQPAQGEPGRIRRSGQVRDEVIASDPGRPISAARMVAPGFSAQTRVGFTSGDQWEPAIAADDHGHIYILYPQYLGVPGCPDCPSPTMMLLISGDGGSTWSAPQQIAPPGTGQWDPQIVVDPLDGQTVYASWLQNSKSDSMVARSTDFGATWTSVVADHSNSGTDKPILAVRGQDVYVAYNHSNTIWIASSHDSGQTFAPFSLRTGNLGWSLPAGGTIAPDGSVYFSWNGYQKSGNASGDVNLYITRSRDGGSTWDIIRIDRSTAAPDCSAYYCGWAFLGAQIVVASDADGVLYILYGHGSVAGGPQRMYFSRSTDGGDTWSAKVDVSLAPQGANHTFPAMVAEGSGDVRIAWMDTRAVHDGTPVWNTYYRSSSNGGDTWSDEVDLSTYVEGYNYIFAEGYSFPFGDYFELDIDQQGVTHIVWGEGLNYDMPGSIWYSRGR